MFLNNKLYLNSQIYYSYYDAYLRYLCTQQDLRRTIIINRNDCSNMMNVVYGHERCLPSLHDGASKANCIK